MPTLLWIFGIFRYILDVGCFVFAPICGAKVQQKKKRRKGLTLYALISPKILG